MVFFTLKKTSKQTMCVMLSLLIFSVLLKIQLVLAILLFIELWMSLAFGMMEKGSFK